MNLSNPARAILQSVPGLNDALDKILSRLNALWDVEHTSAGAHGDVTATSVTVGESVSLEDVGVELSPFSIADFRVDGPGVSWETEDTHWSLMVDEEGRHANQALLLVNRKGAFLEIPFMFWRDATSRQYYLSPQANAGGIRGVNLGTDSYVGGAFEKGFFARVYAGSAKWRSGTGTPEGSVSGNVGDLYSRTDGGAGTSLYVKESGTGNTGWVGK
jgi:hypothetical protein